MHYKTCEICGLRSGRVLNNKRVFMAKFPLDEERCKKWVKVTGNEDLANIPIEKLHQLKHVCGVHFRPKDFKKKKTQLRKNAVPSLLINAEPLSDEILMGFPLHIHPSHSSHIGAGKLKISGDQSENQTAVSDHCESQPAVKINVQDAVNDSQYMAGVDTLTEADDDCYNISDDCQAVDEDSSFYHNVSKRSDNKDDIEMKPQNLDKNEDVHEGFKCNSCSEEIKGYRYTCVQCPDYDLCGSCEARGAHCLHYVLRIPRPKPYTEIQPLLHEIRRLLNGEDTNELWMQPDQIKKEELNDEVMMMNDDGALDIDYATQTLSETKDNVPGITTLTAVTKSDENRQDNNDTVPQVTMEPQLKSHLLNALHTYTRHKQTVTVDKRSAASTSSPYPASTRLIASNRNTLLTRPQAIDNTRTPASEFESQYTASIKLDPDGNNLLTIESNPQGSDKTRTPASVLNPYPVLARLAPQRNEQPLLTFESSLQPIDKTRISASESSQYTTSTRLAADGNTVLTIESSPQAIDNTKTTASESSIFAASTSVSSDGNTVLTRAAKVEDTDSTSRPVPSTPKLYASASITPGDTETISNKIKITADSRLQVPMATKRKCSYIIEASKPSQVVLLKGSKKSATGQPEAQGAVSAARHRTQSTQRDQDAAT